MKTCIIFFAIGMTAIAQLPVSPPDGPMQNEETARKFGLHFGRNLSRIATGFTGLQNYAVILAQSSDVVEELGISPEQMTALTSVRKRQIQGQDIFQQLLGSADPTVIGRLEEKQIDKLMEDAKPLIAKSHKNIHDGIKEVLTREQLLRFTQIYRQSLLMRRRLGPDGTGFGWDFDDEETAQQLKEKLKAADVKIKRQLEALRWQLYVEAFDEVTGKAKVQLGAPYKMDYAISPLVESEHSRKRAEHNTSPNIRRIRRP